MPQGDKRNNDWEFFDSTYDGLWDGDLRRGLGLLVDGKYGPDNYKELQNHAKSKDWVGWKNDTRNGQPVEIKFEFDRVREFSAVHVFANNQMTKDIKVSSPFICGTHEIIGRDRITVLIPQRSNNHQSGLAPSDSGRSVSVIWSSSTRDSKLKSTTIAGESGYVAIGSNREI